jgi:hypothetical protein
VSRRRSLCAATFSASSLPLEGKLLYAIGSPSEINFCSILFGYDSGYISGVLAMNAFKQQFGSKWTQRILKAIGRLTLQAHPPRQTLTTAASTRLGRSLSSSPSCLSEVSTLHPNDQQHLMTFKLSSGLCSLVHSLTGLDVAQPSSQVAVSSSLV